MDIVGHQKEQNLLRGLLKKRLFFASYIFSGPDQVGKKTLAKEFARSLLCLHGHWGGDDGCAACEDVTGRDLLLIDAEFRPNSIIEGADDKAFGIDTSRAIIKFFSTAPSLAARKVVLLDEAHLLTAEAQNSLLKLLEEMPSNAVIILITDKPSYLYETILSRTLQINFSLVKAKEIVDWLKAEHGVGSIKAEELIKFSFGRPGRAFEFWQNKELSAQFKKDVLHLLNFESKTMAQKLMLLKNQTEDAAEYGHRLDLWQCILRDELLFSCGLGDLSLILTKKRQAKVENLVQALKEALIAAETMEKFPAVEEACFKQIVLSSSL